MRALSTALLPLLVLGISTASVNAQTENTTEVQGRHITGKQILVLAKALAKQPKGTIWMDGLGFFPPPPPPSLPPPQLPTPESPLLKPVIKSMNEQLTLVVPDEFEEAKAFSRQLWNVLQICGYEPVFPSGSHGLPPKGISIRVIYHKSRPIADALRESLIASGIKDIRIEEDPKEETYYSTYLPSFKVLLVISIGSQ
jgi:hypothetical protein